MTSGTLSERSFFCSCCLKDESQKCVRCLFQGWVISFSTGFMALGSSQRFWLDYIYLPSTMSTSDLYKSQTFMAGDFFFLFSKNVWHRLRLNLQEFISYSCINYCLFKVTFSFRRIKYHLILCDNFLSWKLKANLNFLGWCHQLLVKQWSEKRLKWQYLWRITADCPPCECECWWI